MIYIVLTVVGILLYGLIGSIVRGAALYFILRRDGYISYGDREDALFAAIGWPFILFYYIVLYGLIYLSTRISLFVFNTCYKFHTGKSSPFY